VRPQGGELSSAPSPGMAPALTLSLCEVDFFHAIWNDTVSFIYIILYCKNCLYFY